MSSTNFLQGKAGSLFIEQMVLGKVGRQATCIAPHSRLRAPYALPLFPHPEPCADTPTLTSLLPALHSCPHSCWQFRTRCGLFRSAPCSRAMRWHLIGQLTMHLPPHSRSRLHLTRCSSPLALHPRPRSHPCTLCSHPHPHSLPALAAAGHSKRAAGCSGALPV